MTTSKKLIEVALPLEAINAACKTDKDRKTGTIRNLHKWFAPMPVPALRALIFAAIVDDPKKREERDRLLRLVEQLVSSVVDPPADAVLAAAREEILKSCDGHLPVIFDPFCGGGSTLVEAQRLGLPSMGSDLNPIPVLISKVLTEFPPAVRDLPPLHPAVDGSLDFASGLAGFLSDVTHYAERIYNTAQARLKAFYPPAPNGEKVIAWFWARTVASPDPRFQGAHTPLVGNWWLSKKKGEFGFITPVIQLEHKRVLFEIATHGVPRKPSKGECLFSGTKIAFDYVRHEGRGGRLGLAMLALATHGSNGRQHFAADDRQRDAANAALPSSPPSLELPSHAIGFRVQGYGLSQWADLFLPRQQLALETFAELVAGTSDWIQQDGGTSEYAQAIAAFLGLCVGKLAQFSSTQCLWKIDSRNGSGKAESAKFGRNDVPMVTDFVETNPFGRSVGDWMQIVTTALRALNYVASEGPKAVVTQADARASGAAITGQALVVTDPPYFDTIGYANLSDYFYVWIRKALASSFPDLFSTVATPKSAELIAEPARHDDSLAQAKAYFVEGFTETFASLQEKARPDLPMVVVYALREQEETEESGRVSGGWEAMLEAILAAGYAITGTWPVHGTGSTRMRGLGANALATYVALVCRPRAESAQAVSRRDLLSTLRSELAPAVQLLQQAAIAPVDLAQAAIGPGMAVFSRFARVVEADGSSMTVGTALALINQVLDETLAEQETDLDADTRWTVAWFEQSGMSPGPFGVAESLSKAKNTAINGLVAAGIVESRAGKVRLLDRDELPQKLNAAADERPTAWEITQHLIRTLQSGGEVEAAQLLRDLGARGETARELAYRLYTISERKKWAKEALAYNSLVVAWPDIARLAGSAAPASQDALL